MVKKWFWIVYLALLAVMVAVATLLPKCSGRLKVLFTLLSVALPLAAFAWNAVAESRQDVSAAAEQPLDEDAIDHIEGMLKACERDRIGINFAEGATQPLPTGASKYGGLPDVPEGFEWPTDKQGRPLSLMMQVNCAEIAPLDKDHLLPPSGMLYFFYQVTEQPWDNSTGGARVLYFDVPNESLHRATCPEALAEDECLTERAVQFTLHLSYPSFSELLNDSADKQYLVDHWDEYFVAYEHLGGDYLNEALGIGLMLGHAQLIQDVIVDNTNENVLLLQLTSDEINDDGVMLGDCGSIYYYISRQDLNDRRFDRPTFALQSY